MVTAVSDISSLEMPPHQASQNARGETECSRALPDRTSPFDTRLSCPVTRMKLPAGNYELLAEDELLEGLSFEAWRRTATYLTVLGTGNAVAGPERWPVTEKEARCGPASG